MFHFNRNQNIDSIEQDIILALYDSYLYFKKEWKMNISFNEYLFAFYLGKIIPELKNELQDDRKRRYRDNTEQI